MSPPDQPRPPIPPTASGEPPGVRASPAAKPWWQRGWGAAIIGVAGLLLGAGVGLAANGHTNTVTTGNATRNVTTTVRTGQPAAPVHTETHIVTRAVTNTVMRTVLEPSHTVAPAPTTFSGTGRKNLGTVTFPRMSTIHWHASGGHFYLRSVPEGAALELKETGTSGTRDVLNGSYEHLEVLATGPWSFTVSPTR